ncbi:hypothetical protein AQUCO_01100043v1 [Aquilegia coerulea]|uniref:Uncharacterized protein n=1 Tax=Aquilegia coerulea TaxID=218851 RepID=A0A2G5E5Y5_AQUCA|nr:hypothetical protein AQUCO_01100043v1 [Aquilegia coerulea]
MWTVLDDLHFQLSSNEDLDMEGSLRCSVRTAPTGLDKWYMTVIITMLFIMHSRALFWKRLTCKLGTVLASS